MIGTGICHVDRKLGHLQFSLSVSEVLHAVSWWRRSGGRTLVLRSWYFSSSLCDWRKFVSVHLEQVWWTALASFVVWTASRVAPVTFGRSITVLEWVLGVWPTCLRPLCILSSVAPLIQSRYRTAYTERGVSRMECRNVLNPRELASKSSFGPWLWIPLPSYTVQCYILKGRNLDCFPSYNLL